MRVVLLAGREVSVSAFIEEGDRVLAHVHRVVDDEITPRERFVVAEVHDGEITELRGDATEPEARDAVHRPSLLDTPPHHEQR